MFKEKIFVKMEKLMFENSKNIMDNTMEILENGGNINDIKDLLNITFNNSDGKEIIDKLFKNIELKKTTEPGEFLLAIMNNITEGLVLEDDAKKFKNNVKHICENKEYNEELIEETIDIGKKIGLEEI